MDYALKLAHCRTTSAQTSRRTAIGTALLVACAVFVAVPVAAQEKWDMPTPYAANAYSRASR